MWFPPEGPNLALSPCNTPCAELETVPTNRCVTQERQSGWDAIRVSHNPHWSHGTNRRALESCKPRVTPCQSRTYSAGATREASSEGCSVVPLMRLVVPRSVSRWSRRGMPCLETCAQEGFPVVKVFSICPPQLCCEAGRGRLRLWSIKRDVAKYDTFCYPPDH